jgi:hypothetical protein
MSKIYKKNPIWKIESLLNVLGLESLIKLDSLITNKDQHYTMFKKMKPNGKIRELYKISPELKRVHRKLKHQIFSNLEFPEFIQGSVKGKDYISNARAHKKSKTIISIDIKNFFPSITTAQVEEIWLHTFNFSPIVASKLAALATYKDCLVQGSALSSYLANLLFLDVEMKFFSKCKNEGIRYSRYVDDITISSEKYLLNSKITKIIQEIFGYIKKFNLKINDEKFKIIRSKKFVSVHKLKVCNENPIMEKKVRKEIRDLVYQCEAKAKTNRSSKEYQIFFNSVLGKVNNLIRLHKNEGVKLAIRLKTIKPLKKVG